MLRAIDHVQIAIPAGGEDAARPFYRDLLGLTEVAKTGVQATRGGCWFEAGAIKVHLGVEEPFRANRKAHVAFLVDDVAAIGEPPALMFLPAAWISATRFDYTDGRLVEIGPEPLR